MERQREETSEPRVSSGYRPMREASASEIMRGVELIHELFAVQAASAPDATAVECQGQFLSYSELDRRATSFAAVLIDRGVEAEERIGIFADRSLEMIVGMIAVLKAGCAYVPLDPGYPIERLSYMIADAGLKLILAQSDLKERLPARTPELIELDQVEEDIVQTPHLDTHHYCLPARPGRLAYLIYTSGSTGVPKGVMVEHYGLVNVAKWHIETFGLRVGTRSSNMARFGFDASAWEVWASLCGGGTLLLAPPAAKDAQELLSWWQCQHLDISFLITPLAELAYATGRINSGVHTILTGGDRLRRVPERFCAGQSLINNYGPTETTIVVTSGEIGAKDEVLHIGRPIRDTCIHLLDSNLQPVQIGESGEIYISGHCVARGYMNRPDLTAERFLPALHNFDPNARMYKTGDLARWRRDGTIEYLGRNDQQVKIRGFRIELGEIETQLLKNPAIRQAVVLAREDAQDLVAYAIPRDSASSLGLTPESLRLHLAPLLPEYMIPSAFVLLLEYPVTPNGKLDFRALPAPPTSAFASRRYEPPRGDAERDLAQIWQRVLRVELVGRLDNFQELGGHSLHIVEVKDLLHRAGFHLDIRSVYTTPNLAALAAVLSRRDSKDDIVPDSRIPLDSAVITPDMLPLTQLTQKQIDQVIALTSECTQNIQDIYPLSPLQEGILFHHLLADVSSDTYVLPILFRVVSPEALQRFVEALKVVIERHDVLRTSVHWSELPRPLQVVHRRVEIPIETAMVPPTVDVLEYLKQRMSPEFQKLGLAKAPLLRLQIARDARSDRCYVLMQLHHLLCDHVSMDTLLSEVGKITSGHRASLPVPTPYRAHVAQSLIHAEHRDDGAFFKRKLGDVTWTTAPFGLVNVLGGGDRIQRLRQSIDPKLSARVRTEAQRLGVGVGALFHAVWALVTAHLTGKDDVVFGTLLLGRLQGDAGSQCTVGMFINTLPIRLRLRGLTAEDFVYRTHQELVDLLDHEQASLAVAQRCSGVTGAAPLFSSILNYRHSVENPETEEHTIAEGVDVIASREWTNYPVTVAIDDFNGQFSLDVKTEKTVSPSRLCEIIAAATEELISALEHSPRKSVVDLPVLPVRHRSEILSGFNSASTPFPRERLLQELFEEQVARAPDTTAIVSEGTTLTYYALNERANDIARILLKKGVTTDQLVGVFVERSADMVAGLIAIWKAGGAYVPLDPSYPRARLDMLIEDAALKLIVTQRELINRLPAARGLEAVVLDQETSKVGDIAASDRGVFKSGQLAYVIYTSGSTGQPKGVMIEHRNVVSLWQGLQQLYRENPRCQRVAVNASICFDSSVKQLVQLLSGRTLVLIPEGLRTQFSDVAGYLRAEGVDCIDCTPSQLKLLIEGGLYRDENDPRMTLIGGEPVDAALWSTLAQRTNRRFYNVYGPTESTVDATYSLVSRESDVPNIGCPMENRRLYILDDLGHLAPIGVVGELFIGGAGVARGYLDQPTLTAQRFVADPFTTDSSGRMYKTGDLGRWRADGSIECLGRNDNQVKIRGFRLECGEIEGRLMKCEEIKAAVVLARTDGHGDSQLVAYVVPSGKENVDMSMSAKDLRAKLKKLLPEYMIPRSFAFLQKLPLSPNGKVDRLALANIDVRVVSTAHLEPLEGEVETLIASHWKDILRIPECWLSPWTWQRPG